MITQCCIEALYALGKESQAVVNIAKTFERRRCNHRTAIAADDCLKDVVGETNKHRYVLSAQSLALRNAVANVPGLPIIHFNPRGVLVLSPPSRATLKHKDAQEEARRLEGADALAGVEDGDNVVGAAMTEPVKRNRVKGPNPLSVKKKKTAETGGKREEKVEEIEQAKKKKNRKRGKGLVKQVKEEIEAERAAEAARGRASGEGSEGGGDDDAHGSDGGDSGMESD